MKMLTAVLLVLIVALTAYIIINRPAPPIPEPAYQEIIDSLETQIATTELLLEQEREKRDSLEKAGIQIITVRDTILREVKNFPPTRAVEYFDSITPGTRATQITEAGIITELSRIQAANHDITQNKFLKEQIRNDALIIESLDAQIEQEQEINSIQQRKFTTCENSRQEIAGENERLKKRVKWWKGATGVTTVIAIIALII